MLGLLESLADEQNIGLEPHMVSNVSKVITFLETFKALRLASEQGASHDKFGYLVPAASPLIASSILFPKFYPEMVEMIQLLGSSGLIMIPSEWIFDRSQAPTLINI